MEENDINEDNVLEENETEEDGNARPESGNNINNNNIQDEITGVTEEENINTVPILEEEKDPDEYITYKYYIRIQHKQ